MTKMDPNTYPENIDENLEELNDVAAGADESSGSSINSTETEHVEGDQDTSSTIDAEDLRRLIDDLDALVMKLKAMHPDYSPPPYSTQRLVGLVENNVGRLTPEVSSGILEKMRLSINEDWFDPDTWKGMWYMLNYYLEYQGDRIKRRISGDYETDDWGLDPEFLDSIKPFFDFLYNKYWRVETTGMENIPAEGRAILVANHSGQIPWDGAMIGTAVLNEHQNHRVIRALYANWFPGMPFLSDILVKMGQTLADEENGIRLLDEDELVLVFPEGLKGISKLFKDRYQLARFGRGGFVRMALKTGSPIIPISVVGAEETYITLRHTPFVKKLTGLPVPPISLRWPWLGLFGLIPLPTKWYIDIGEPIHVSGYSADELENLILVSQLTNQVRNIIQGMIHYRLSVRTSIFTG